MGATVYNLASKKKMKNGVVDDQLAVAAYNLIVKARNMAAEDEDIHGELMKDEYREAAESIRRKWKAGGLSIRPKVDDLFQEFALLVKKAFMEGRI